MASVFFLYVNSKWISFWAFGSFSIAAVMLEETFVVIYLVLSLSYIDSPILLADTDFFMYLCISKKKVFTSTIADIKKVVH